LLAVMAGMYAVYHGPKGLKKIANQVHAAAVTIAEAAENLGIEQVNNGIFETLQIKAPAVKVRTIAESKNYNFFYPNADTVVLSTNETINLEDINNIIGIFAEATGKETEKITAFSPQAMIPVKLERTSAFLEHKVFNSYHSESQMMR